MGARVDTRRRDQLLPGRTGLSRTEIEASQRARLREAAFEVIARRGFYEADTRTICGVAGVSRKSLYDYYPGGSGEFLLDVVRVGLREARSATRASAAEGLAAGVAGFLSYFGVHPAVGRTCLVEAAAAPRPIRAIHNAELRSFGIFAPLDDRSAEMAMGATVALVACALNDGVQVLDSLTPDLVRVIGGLSPG